MGWTEKQQKAIDARGTSLLVSAAAGSGKTAVLVERIKKLILEDGVSLENLLIVTFTKAAAAEMKERLRKDLNKELEVCTNGEKSRSLRHQLSLLGRADICTFDSFSRKIVKNYYHIIGCDPDLKICDEARGSILRNEAMEEMFRDCYDKKDPDFLDFLDHYAGVRSDAAVREMISALYFYADTLPEPAVFLHDPEFDPAEFLALAASFAAEAVKKSIGYSRMVLQMFEENKLPKLGEKIKLDISALESVLAAFEGETPELGFSMLSEMKFQQLRAAKEEKAGKDALELQIKALRDKGAKDVLDEYKKHYGSISIERLTEEKEAVRRPLTQLCRLTEEFSARYSAKKAEAGLMDFSDGEHFALHILENEAVQKELREKYEYIFVDEYQDSNMVQDTLIRRISRPDNVFLVGDVKQSIYKFRHAEPELFLEKYGKYKAGQVPDAALIDLNSNFRSKKGVVDFVNRVFAGIMTKESTGIVYDEDAALTEGLPYTGPWIYEPEIFLADSAPEESEDADPALEELKKDELEALMAVDIIRRYRGSSIQDKDAIRSLDYRDMVILLRSAKGKAELYYQALSRAGIPVYLERSEGYFDTPEIQVLLNLLRIIDNFRQDVPLISVMYFPVFGFTTAELSEIRVHARRSGKNRISYARALEYYLQCYEETCAAEAAGNPSSFENPALGEKCRSFAEKIRGWRIRASALPLPDFIWNLLQESGMQNFAAALKDGQQRLANLRALADKAAEYESTNAGGLSGFIAYIENISGANSKVSTGQSKIVGAEDNVVRIMTVHGSKGLEFPFVLLAGTGSSAKKSSSTSRAAYHKDMGASMVLSDPANFCYSKPLSYKLIREREARDSLAEEIRVLYVALTRARDILVLSGSVKDAARFLEKRPVFALKGASAGSFLEMMLPYADPDRVHVLTRGDFSLKTLELGAEQESEFRRKLAEGFETDAAGLELPSEEIRRRLEFDYAPPAAESAKKKYSVSEIAAEERIRRGEIPYDFREEAAVPRFMTGKAKLGSAAVGTAYHKVMEHLPFTPEHKSEAEISAFIASLQGQGILTADEAAVLQPRRIANFFASELGARVCRAEELRKEAPFTLKKQYQGREVLVQGTVDCYFKENDAYVLVDYKSNWVDSKNIEEEKKRLAEEYLLQLALYKEALETITGIRVAEADLYLFSADCFVPLTFE